jgi:DNA repair photolyase
MCNVQYIESKSILSKIKGRDTLFGIARNMNLYRGCQHGCIYCDTRSECYGIKDLSTISVKKNALCLLQKELAALRRNKGTIGTGSMNDPYMPLEKKLEQTRKALQLIASERFPVHIITKSDLVVRDADILQDLSKTYAAVSFTVTTADDALCRKIEPHAPPSSERFRAMQILSNKGIYTGLTLMPLLPFINDTVKNLETLLRQAKESGASYILPLLGVTLRKGSRDYFYRALDARFPGLKERYQSAFGDRYECFSPAFQSLSHTLYELSDKWGIALQMRFYEPPVYEQLSLF